MKNNFKVTIPITILVTLLAIIYQRSTGPTYPKKFTLEGMESTLKLPRSHGGESDAPIEIPKFKPDLTGHINYKRFPTDDPWTKTDFQVLENRLIVNLPKQPNAGKLEYFIELKSGETPYYLGSETNPIIIRFKGHVPEFILIPHIILMFISMLLSTLASSEALFNTKTYGKITVFTTLSLIIGGMILGPIVQKYAFGVYWAGFPFGLDLTDNKLLISVIAWVVALLLNIRKNNRIAVIIAGLVLISMYAIPHSTMGSQFNYNTNKVETKTK